MILIKSFLTRVLFDCFKLLCAHINEWVKVRKCYSCLKMIMQTHLLIFFTIYSIKRAPRKRFYLYIKRLQSSTIFQQRKNHEVSCDWNFFMNFLTTANSKNIIATLSIHKNLSWHSFFYYISIQGNSISAGKGT